MIDDGEGSTAVAAARQQKRQKKKNDGVVFMTDAASRLTVKAQRRPKDVRWSALLGHRVSGKGEKLAKGDVLAPEGNRVEVVGLLQISGEGLQLHAVRPRSGRRIKRAVDGEHLIVGRETEPPLPAQGESAHKKREEGADVAT